MKKPKVSVAMAAFNGEQYISEQISSILNNLSVGDELIISDDGSSDETVQLIKHYMKKDPRIKLIHGPKKGIKANFENALRECSGEIIFLSDQDDIWADNKVQRCLEPFNDISCMAINHNGEMVNALKEKEGYTLFEWRKSGSGIIKNMWKNSYVGCCMAFRSQLLPFILPIPADIEMHDQWIGLLAEYQGRTVFIEDKLIKYRRHETNASSLHHHSLLKMVKNRMILMIRLMERIKKYKKTY